MDENVPEVVRDGLKRWRSVLKFLAPEFVSEVGGLIWTESHFDPEAERYEAGYRRRYLEGNSVWEKRIEDEGWSVESVASSYGLMQLMFPTAWALGYRGGPEGLKQAETSLVYGCMLFAGLFDRYGDVRSALAAYNGGSARKVDGIFVNQGYVDKVMRKARILREEGLC
ncbi:transglycosylase SLT domain-containing protein [Candidatus Hydrogenedentota bacterium]